MQMLTLKVLQQVFVVHRFPANTAIPQDCLNAVFCSITRTDSELSIVCSSELSLESNKQESGWSGMQILGPLDFSEIGIMSKICLTLAQAKISVFAVSTFDTDYFLVKTVLLEHAIQVLRGQGYQFVA